MRQPTEVTMGQRIAQARRIRGVELWRDLLQSDVAEALDVGGATVSRWEADQAVPRDDALARLAEFLGVSAPYLRYGDPKPAPPEPLVWGQPMQIEEARGRAKPAAKKRRRAS